METNRFFLLIWRLNALLITGAGLMLALAGAYAMASLVRDAVRPGVITSPVRPAPSPGGPATSLDAFIEVPDTLYLIAEVKGEEREDSAGRGSSYSLDHPVRNLVILDAGAAAARRVLPDDGAVLGSYQMVPRQTGTRTAPPEALLVTAHRADTDGNGRVNRNDAGDLVAAPLAGGAALVLATNVRRILAVTARGERRFAAVVENRAGLRLVEFSLDGLRVLRDVAVEIKP